MIVKEAKVAQKVNARAVVSSLCTVVTTTTRMYEVVHKVRTFNYAPQPPEFRRKKPQKQQIHRNCVKQEM